jgi:hypothetical protein
VTDLVLDRTRFAMTWSPLGMASAIARATVVAASCAHEAGRGLTNDPKAKTLQPLAEPGAAACVSKTAASFGSMTGGGTLPGSSWF